MTDQRLDATLDRDLRDLFAAGPSVAPPATLQRALALADTTPQRRPRFASLDRNAWPPRRGTVGDPSIGRLMRVAATALVVLLAGAALAVGARLLDGPPSIDLTSAGSLTVARQDPTLRLWIDGRLLVNDEFIFDPATGTASRLEVADAPGPTPSAYPLPDGRVVLVYDDLAGELTIGARFRVAIIDPGAGSVTEVGQLPPYRWQRGELVLRDGRILVTGGIDVSSSGIGDAYATVTLFDPATGTSTELPPLLQPRYMHSMVELSDGRILIAGGQNRDHEAEGLLTDVEVYDLRAGSAEADGAITVRPGFAPLWVTLVPLGDGRVLISGASVVEEPCGPLPPPSGSPPGLPSAHAVYRVRTHVFDPASDAISDGPQVPSFRGAPVGLDGDRLLLFGEHRSYAGGCAADVVPFDYPWVGVVDLGAGTIFESHNPVTGVATLDLRPERLYSSGVRLPDGRVAVIEATPDTGARNVIDLLTIR